MIGTIALDAECIQNHGVIVKVLWIYLLVEKR